MLSSTGRVKARGNANNDWQVTVDLINETNHSPPAQLDKVTEQWEAIYQVQNKLLL